MRKTLLLLLLATSAAPAIAAAGPEDRDARRAARAERIERAESRSDAREERADRPQREGRAERPQREERVVPVDVRSFNGGGGFDAAAADNGDRVRFDAEQRRVLVDERRAGRRAGNDGVEPVARRQRDAVERVGQVRRNQRQDYVPGSRRIIAAAPAGARPGVQAPAPRVNPNDFFRHRDTWRSDWRNDHRYDWRRHRDSNRWLYNLGYYYDPFGWGYNRFSIGWRLWPSYYGSSYWINDPWMYRLPPAYGPYRWVRYWNDALLVNVYSGQVVDVMYDFFW